MAKTERKGLPPVSAFLAQYYDPELDVKEDVKLDDISKVEVERLNKLLAVTQACIIIPRRLGGDATDDELSADKRRCKRIQHVATQCIQSWGGKVAPSGDVAREAAQVKWDKWWDDHRVYLTNRLRFVATWATKPGADEKWAKSAVVKLSNELRWLEYAMR